MGNDLEIRPLSDLDECREAQRIMQEVWGALVDDVEPTHALIAVAHAGGLVSGAFAGGRLLGFTLAFPGRAPGWDLLYSHMAAVRPEEQGRGIGSALKWHQRRWAVEQGFDLIRWTFDPLMAANARFNLRRLGASAGRYIVDFYGRSGSALHGDLPTDRLVADWELADPRVAQLEETGPAPLLAEDPSDLPLLYDLVDGEGGGQVPAPVTTMENDTAPLLLAPVPDRFLEMQRIRPADARTWRERTRKHFQLALAGGYRFVDFTPPSGASEELAGCYLMSLPGAGETRAP